MRVIMLGCGASTGVPVVGCQCAVCTSNNQRNKRLRPSILIEHEDFRLLVDAGPDLRQQSLNNDITQVDAVLFTHAHADHCHGIDDIRNFNFHKNGPVDCYADAETLAEIQLRFEYAFQPPIPEYGWFRACLSPHLVTEGTHRIGPWDARIFPQRHGRIHSLGLRIGDFAYSTDVNHLTEANFAVLEGTKVWIIDCLRRDPAPTHAHLALTLEWIARVKPERAILTHMGHDFDYAAFLAELPKGVEPGYDGLEISL